MWLPCRDAVREDLGPCGKSSAGRGQELGLWDGLEGETGPGVGKQVGHSGMRRRNDHVNQWT